jgi:hypothetical protein
VPRNGLAYIHKGESVLNVKAADMWRSAVNYGRNDADNMFAGRDRSRVPKSGVGYGGMNVGSQYVTVVFPGVTDAASAQGVGDEFVNQTSGGKGGGRNSRRTDAQRFRR